MVWGLNRWSSPPLRNLWSPLLASCILMSRPRGSKAALWRASTSAWMSSSPMPPTRLTVPVKYLSMTSFEMPTASKIWLPW